MSPNLRSLCDFIVADLHCCNINADVNERVTRSYPTPQEPIRSILTTHTIINFKSEEDRNLYKLIGHYSENQVIVFMVEK